MSTVADGQSERARCSCGKAIYASRGQARKGMRGLQQRQKKQKLHVYYCEESRSFHVGHAQK